MDSDERKAFQIAVFTAVNQIPYGSVTSYGHIAELVGKPRNARQVGSTLKHSSQLIANFRQEGIEFDNLPWWRVISSSGLIAERDYGAVEQKRHLLAEDVEVTGMRVRLSDHGWFPEELED